MARRSRGWGRLALGLLGIALSIADSGARAGGYGLYNEGELAKSKIDARIPFNTDTVVRDYEQAMWGIGFSYDTNVARDAPWNYRFRVGMRYGKRDFDQHDTIFVGRRIEEEDPDEKVLSYDPKTDTLFGFTLHQTIGYGLLRNESLRLWAGPSLRLDVEWQNLVTNLDSVDVSIGAGPELGINYHVSDRISLAGSVAYDFMYAKETFQVDGPNRQLDGYEHIVSAAITIFWRTEDDRFEAR